MRRAFLPIMSVPAYNSGMLFGARIGQRELASLCRRLATSLEAGIDIRRVFEREAAQSHAPARRSHLGEISAAVRRGDSLSDALAESGEYFPRLFREMVEVGEQTGKLAEVLAHLAEHYDHQVKLRRDFLASMTWPVVQLTAAVLIIGFLIWFMGTIPSTPVDVLGLGLIGANGAITFFCGVAVIVAAFYLAFQAMRRGQHWARPIELVLTSLPVLGPNLSTLALSRLAWSLHLTLDTGMELRRAIPLSLRSTRSARFAEKSDAVVAAVLRGRELSHAFADTGAFPRDFLDVLEVGERSGRLPESMAILSRQYQERARQALSVLNVVAGFLVWGLVAALITLMIFRLFLLFYLGPINEALKGV